MGVMGALAEPSCCPSAQALTFKPVQKTEAGPNRPCTASLAFPLSSPRIHCAGGGSRQAGREGWSGSAGVPLLLEMPQRCPCALPADLLQVLLPLVLALAALHGGPAPPPPADAQPEEPRLQLRGRRGAGLPRAESWENLP